jgi:hypothetical protein
VQGLGQRLTLALLGGQRLVEEARAFCGEA